MTTIENATETTIRSLDITFPMSRGNSKADAADREEDAITQMDSREGTYNALQTGRYKYTPQEMERIHQALTDCYERG